MSRQYPHIILYYIVESNPADVEVEATVFVLKKHSKPALRIKYREVYSKTMDKIGNCKKE